MMDTREQQLAKLRQDLGLLPGAELAEIARAQIARKELVKGYLCSAGSELGLKAMRDFELGVDPDPGGHGADWDGIIWPAALAADHRYTRMTRRADGIGYVIPEA
jgi:hypothetical protein